MAQENIPKMPKAGPSARIDKWLWAARIYKTRSTAVDAIKNGRVTIDGVNVKPSRIIKTGETARHLLLQGALVHRAARRSQTHSASI